MQLNTLGWNEFFAHSFEPHQAAGYIAARVALEHRGAYTLYSEQGELAGEIAGKLRYQARNAEDFPAVGDWVVVEMNGDRRATIHQILPRKSKFSRKAVGCKKDSTTWLDNKTSEPRSLKKNAGSKYTRKCGEKAISY